RITKYQRWALDLYREGFTSWGVEQSLRRDMRLPQRSAKEISDWANNMHSIEVQRRWQQPARRQRLQKREVTVEVVPAPAGCGGLLGKVAIGAILIMSIVVYLMTLAG